LRRLRSPAEYAEEFGAEISGEPKQETQKENWYVGFARRAGGMFKAQDKYSKEEYGAALEFLGWDLKAREVNAAPTLALVLGLIIAVIGFAYLYYMVFVTQDLYVSFEDFSTMMPLFYPAMGLILIPFVLVYYIQSYPIRAADVEKMKSITYIPEIVNYMVMSMKLTSNLERAVEFAGEHGKGKIANDLKELTWHIKIGTYKTMEQGLDELAYKWGRYSDEFKHALMLIRSSIIEIDEAKRALILDKAMSDVLEGIKDSMEKYAMEMRQPSVYLYYLGVLLPLMLIVMLPIGSMMADLPIAQTWVLVLLYNIGIPLGTILFAQNILKKRPPIYTPPAIPDTYPALPKKGNMKVGGTEMSAAFLAVIAAIGIFLLFYMVIEQALNPYPPNYADESVRAAHYPFFTLAGAVIGICSAVSIYLYGISAAKRKVQKDIMAMEVEFQDSVYVLASRLGENRPIEEAVSYTADFLTTEKIASVFRRASENITNLGMTIEMALFDPIYGALKDVPSDLIRGSMRIVIDSINLGVQQGARALISLSMQLRDSQKIKEKIASLLEEITSMMKSIAFLIAPLVLGITVALQKIIINALKAVSVSQSTSSAGNEIGMTGFGLGNPAMLENIPSPPIFLLIIAIYVIQITLILIYFTSKIEEGENDLAMKINIAVSLPISIILFFMAAWFTNSFSFG
jgi:uncharacterized membrane protein